MKPDQKQRAAAFKALNERGGLLLPNAWDAASARLFEAEGHPAVATTSSGVAHARGYRDGEGIGRERMVAEIANIARVVAIPVSADIESGYGPAPEDVAATVAGVIDAGAVGINLEDNTHGTAAETLFPTAAQAGRVAAARAQAVRQGLDLTINARTDPFLYGLGADDEERLAMALERGRAYLDAGADLVFVPGLVDPALIRPLAQAFGGRLSLMAGRGAPPAAELFAAGARRVSVGPAAMLASYAVARAIARELRDPARSALQRDSIGFGELDSLFAAEG